MLRPAALGPTTALMSGPTEAEFFSPDRARLAQSFDATAAAYELGRPEYPDEALTFWDDHGAFERDNVILDLAAGTGKLTRLLPMICKLHAVEPLAQMRAEFSRAVPDVEVLDGTAEHIPFPDDTFDAVLVGQAFHWFDHQVALNEIARVLKPGGGLGMIWNEDDVDVAAWLVDVVDEKRATAASTIVGKHPVIEIIDANSSFGPVETFECRWEYPTSLEGVLADVLSRSYVSALPPEERLPVLTRTREAIERHLGSGVETISYPYRTTAFWSLLIATDPA
jgi:ubiquinone/menaquinone biosynthesis C-methylase UbiE